MKYVPYTTNVQVIQKVKDVSTFCVKLIPRLYDIILLYNKTFYTGIIFNRTSLQLPELKLLTTILPY